MALGDEALLDGILLKARTPGATHLQLIPEELRVLIYAFLSTTHDASYRGKGYVALSLFCQTYRNSGTSTDKAQDDTTTERLTRIFQPLLDPLFSDIEEPSLLACFSFLTALFQVDGQTASRIFLKEGILDTIMDCVELSPSSTLSLSVAHLLGQAYGHKGGRDAVTSQSKQWLRAQVRQTTDPVLRAAASVAMVKLVKGLAVDSPDEPVDATFGASMTDEDYAEMLKQVIECSNTSESTLDAIEGLAYLSMKPEVKELLSRDVEFLKNLFLLLPDRKHVLGNPSLANSTSVVYGVLVIIANICAFRPRLTEEQTQMQKLKQMTKTGKKASLSSSEVEGLDTDEHVRIRAKRLLDAGVLSVFASAISTTESTSASLYAGKALFGIIEGQANRGLVLQSGGAKTLRVIIKRILEAKPRDPSRKNIDLDAADLEPIQALAKLAITASPLQVFGPNVGSIIDALRPLSELLQQSSSTMLQRFEAMMALTNLASYNNDVAIRIAGMEGLMNKVELLILEDHILIRRGAMELLCNLITGSDDVFRKYSSESKLIIILALSDVEDIATRLAASGSLAVLTSTARACQALARLQSEKERVFAILTQLIDPSALSPQYRYEDDMNMQTNSGLIHRGAVCVLNFFMHISDEASLQHFAKAAKEAGLYQALVNVVEESGSKQEVFTQAAKDALKILDGSEGKKGN